jgi:murein DD-endopeptidase MepM/ murein hydrolase activator NlpD
MSKEKRRGGPVLFAGLGGFALGAATVLFVVWVYGVRPASQAGGESMTPGMGVAAGAPWAGTPWSGGPGGGAPGAAGAPGTAPIPGAPESAAGANVPGGASHPGGGAPGAGPSAPPAAVPGTAIPGASPPAAGEPHPTMTPALQTDVDALRRHQLLLPVQGVRREQLRDSFSEGRAGHLHEALDIMAERGTPVLAVEDGRLAKLFFSAQGGNTVYQFDPAATYAYYYAHLERYADGLREGDPLRRGQVIGFVGTSGNAPANAPHLHFAIFRLTPEKHWWQGTAIDPYLVLTP